MELRRLGKNGPEVSAISFGSMAVKADDKTAQGNKQQIIRLLRQGIDEGINFLNTADFYGMGLYEMIIGEAIKGRRDRVFVSVKTGSLRDPNGHFLGFDGSPKAIKNFCAYSLMRLGVDEIDLYQPARIDPSVPVEDTVGAIKDLIQEGKVRYLGISEANAKQLKKAHQVHPVSALEIEYSLATRFIENEILPTARELGISIVPYSVLSYGLLSGKLKAPLEKGDTRNIFPRFQGDKLVYNLKKVQELEVIANSKGVSTSQLALAWVLNQGKDIIPIVGMSKSERIKQNIAALDISFTSDEMRSINDLFKPGAIIGDRYPVELMDIVAS